MVSVSIVFNLLHLVVAFFVKVESPKWLLMESEVDIAGEVLQRLRKVMDVTDEIDLLIREDKNKLHHSFRQLCTSSNTNSFFVSLFVSIIQQMSGATCIFLYIETILTFSGLPKDPSLDTLASILTGVVSSIFVLMTFFSMVLVEIIGRKPLLIFGSFGMFLSLLSTGIFLKLNELEKLDPFLTGWLSIIALIVYFTFYSVGWISIPCFLTSELFATENRAMAMSLSSLSNWIALTILYLLFIPLAQSLKGSVWMWVFSLFSLISGIFVASVVPETSGRTVQKILNHW